MAERAHLSIGEVLSLVQEDFPDITISKIRFLESQGLLDPERTPSGYRKFYESDIDRLQWILAQQRDHFLPLKVIRDRLDEWDATGERPAEGAPGPGETDDSGASQTPSGAGERWDETPPEVPVTGDDDVRHAAASLAAASAMEVAPRPEVLGREPEPEPVATEVVDAPAPAPPPVRADVGPDDRSLTAEELAARAGVAVAVVHELEAFSMITSRRVGPETYYDVEHLPAVRACRAFLERGVEVRHLRMYKIAAEREAGVLEQLIMPLLKQRNPDARARAVATVEELSEAGEALHAALLRQALQQTLPARD